MSKFKNQQNVRYLQGLFFEQTREDKSTVVYTLKDDDHMGFPSLYRLYIAENDPTEYLFATKYLDGWEHWEMLCQCTWFKPYLDRWRKELALKIAADNIQRIMLDAASGSKTSVASQKFLATHGYDSPSKNPKGRPSKEAQKAAAKEAASEAFRINQDFNRIQKGAKAQELN